MDTPPEGSQSIDGFCDARFAAVREAFADNLAGKNEIGAAVSIWVEGTRVADLWGGYADGERRTPWQADTLVNAYSVGKGVLATLTLRLVDLGLLDYDAPVAKTWPELAANDKGAITLRQLLSHQAGLPAVRERLAEGAMLDWDLMCGALAAQAPYWSPGTHHGYHVNTFGYLVGEVIRRATGKPVGQALADYLTGPLDSDYWWGLPASEHGRVARVHTIDADRSLSDPEEWKRVFPETGDEVHDRMIWHAYFNPGGLSGSGAVNTAAWREAAIPSTNGHCNARAVATIYNALVPASNHTPPIASGDLVARARAIESDGTDRVLGKPSRFGLGFQLAQPTRPIGPNPETFGHYGYGGSLGFADPRARVAFGYVRNQPGKRWETACTRALIDALYGALTT